MPANKKMMILPGDGIGWITAGTSVSTYRQGWSAALQSMRMARR
jgi:hypothetical protein